MSLSKRRAYRCYLMDSSKRIRTRRDLVCPSDETTKTEGYRFAKEQPHYPRLEVWGGPQLLWYGHPDDL